MRAPFIILGLFAAFTATARAQEASSGFDLRTTLSAQVAVSPELAAAPRFGAAAAPGYRVVVYPSYKFDPHWSLTAALQSNSRPYFYDGFAAPGYGDKNYLLNASLNYARVSDNSSLLVRAGALQTAFGAFVLRYDDADNAVVDIPPGYGYYYQPVSPLPVLGVQAEATVARFDARLQLANSSPANPLSITANEQHPNIAGGVGFTPRQGLRLGVSGFHGPYISDNNNIPGEIASARLPASGLGADLSFTRGFWKLSSEYLWTLQPWTVIPNTREHDFYLELRRTLGPRWYAATRGGFSELNGGDNAQTYEGTLALRPNRLQILKLDYEFRHVPLAADVDQHILTVQLVTSLHLFTWTRH